MYYVVYTSYTCLKHSQVCTARTCELDSGPTTSKCCAQCACQPQTTLRGILAHVPDLLIRIVPASILSDPVCIRCDDSLSPPHRGGTPSNDTMTRERTGRQHHCQGVPGLSRVQISNLERALHLAQVQVPQLISAWPALHKTARDARGGGGAGFCLTPKARRPTPTALLPHAVVLTTPQRSTACCQR